MAETLRLRTGQKGILWMAFAKQCGRDLTSLRAKDRAAVTRSMLLPYMLVVEIMAPGLRLRYHADTTALSC